MSGDATLLIFEEAEKRRRFTSTSSLGFSKLDEVEVEEVLPEIDGVDLVIPSKIDVVESYSDLKAIIELYDEGKAWSLRFNRHSCVYCISHLHLSLIW